MKYETKLPHPISLGDPMKNEAKAPSVNLFPILALSVLTLICTIAAIVMLVGLHNKVKAAPSVSSAVMADEFGNISLDDQNTVRINLMKRNAGGKVEPLQEVAIPLENFMAGFQQQEEFVNQLIEKEIITRQ